MDAHESRQYPSNVVECGVLWRFYILVGMLRVNIEKSGEPW